MFHKLPSLPFLVRKMLNFEHGISIQLRLRTRANSSEDLLITGITREGIFKFRHDSQGDGSAVTSTFSLPDIPTMVSVTPRVGNIQPGQTFAVLSLLINGEIIAELASGLVYQGKGLSWPATNNPNSRIGGGFLFQESPAGPAAGAEISVQPDTAEVWRIYGVHFRLVTDANAANRRVHLGFAFGGDAAIEAFADIDQPESTTREYHCAAWGTLPSRADDDDILIPIPIDLIIPTGGTIFTSTTNLQVGDQFGQIGLQLDRFWRQL